MLCLDGAAIILMADGEDKEGIKKILEQLEKLQISVSSIDSRVQKLEIEEDPRASAQVVDDTETTETNVITDHRSRSSTQPTIVGPSSTETSTAADIQKDYERVRDSLNRTPVPDGFRVHDSAVGIKQENKQALKILSKCARYSETALKIVNGVTVIDNQVRISEGELNCLFTCLAAQINFLQCEYTSLVVKSTFDEETASIFRQFENNTQTFSDDSLRSIRVGAELSSLTARNSQAGAGRRVAQRGHRSERGFPRGQRRPTWRSDFAGRL